MKTIEEWCKKLNIKNYIINADGTVDIDGDVNIFDRNLDRIPIKFGIVTGYFCCSRNKLKILKILLLK